MICKSISSRPHPISWHSSYPPGFREVSLEKGSKPGDHEDQLIFRTVGYSTSKPLKYGYTRLDHLWLLAWSLFLTFNTQRHGKRIKG